MAASSSSSAAAGCGAASSAEPPPAKRARRDLGAAEDAWGCVVEDVSAAVDWTALTEAFDAFTSARLWALRATAAGLAEALPLRATGERRPLLQVAAGEDCGGDDSASSGAASAAGAPGDGTASAAASDSPPVFALSRRVALRKAEGRGRGWFATAPLAAGTVVLVEKPLVSILDGEWRGEDWAGCDGSDTAALGLELARKFAPSLGALLAHLHPQPGVVPNLSRESENGEDPDSDADEVALRDAVAKGWAAVAGLSEAEKERLRHVVRLNSLGFYTNSEQLCHHGNFTALTGSGIYALASGFNHSCEPNVTRFSIGDVTAFVTNRPIEAGDELCISYIESEHLCAPKSVRSQSLDRDFTCACRRCAGETGEGLPTGGQRRYLLVDEQLQASLAVLPPENRVEAVQAFLRGELSGDGSGSEDEDGAAEEGGSAAEVSDAGPLVILGKDAQELRVVEAVAMMQSQKYADALPVWRRLAAFTCQHCPPFDEALPVYAVQSALCALASDDEAAAAGYAAAAASAHRVVCGADLFRWRYRVEVDNSAVGDEVKQRFWELPPIRTSPTAAVTWGEAVAAWAFDDGEAPKAFEVV